MPKQRGIIVPFLIVLNVLVYIMWNMYGNDDTNFMQKNFLVSWEALAEGRVWTLITSAFSHNLLWMLLTDVHNHILPKNYPKA